MYVLLFRGQLLEDDSTHQKHLHYCFAAILTRSYTHTLFSRIDSTQSFLLSLFSLLISLRQISNFVFWNFTFNVDFKGRNVVSLKRFFFSVVLFPNIILFYFLSRWRFYVVYFEWFENSPNTKMSFVYYLAAAGWWKAKHFDNTIVVWSVFARVAYTQQQD